MHTGWKFKKMYRTVWEEIIICEKRFIYVENIWRLQDYCRKKATGLYCLTNSYKEGRWSLGCFSQTGQTITFFFTQAKPPRPPAYPLLFHTTYMHFQFIGMKPTASHLKQNNHT